MAYMPNSQTHTDTIDRMYEDPDAKSVAEHADVVSELKTGSQSRKLKSEYDTLTVPQTLWLFRKAIGFAVIIGCTALADGYAGMING